MIDELTPVLLQNGLLFKRDDYYQPFGPYHVNGGKIRQAFKIFEAKLGEIKNVYNNGVITAASVHSPQGPNIAKMAAHFGIRCVVAVGGTSQERLSALPMMVLSQYYGADIKVVAGHGMTPVIHARTRELALQHNYMPIETGELVQINPAAIFDSTAQQVENIPDSLENLIVPTGVAVQLTGILRGLKRFKKKVNNIYSICVGPTREEKVDLYLRMAFNDTSKNYPSFKMIQHGSPYSKGYNIKVAGEYLDDLYEAKAYDWMSKNLNYRNKDTLLWCVGRRPRAEDVNRIIDDRL